MNADIQAKLDLIKAPFAGVIEAADAVPALVEAGEKAKFDEGFAAGQASIVLPKATLPDGTVNPEVLYTQADMDKLADTVRGEEALKVKPQLDELVSAKAANEELKAQVGAFPEQQQAAVDAALGDLKLQLRAHYEAHQVAITSAETGFAEFLK